MADLSVTIRLVQDIAAYAFTDAIDPSLAVRILVGRRGLHLCSVGGAEGTQGGTWLTAFPVRLRSPAAAALPLAFPKPPPTLYRTHSALRDCTVQLVGMLPTFAVEETVVPFMNQMDVLPLVSRHSMSLVPLPS
jgi:hypothetical protein